MTTHTEVQYEERTARAMRGMESRTIKKWQDDGWELVSQTQGKLQSQITFRRPKPKSRRLSWIIGGGALALILGTVITVGVISERNVPVETAEPATSPTKVVEEESAPQPTQAEATPITAPKPGVLTPENSPELAAILALGDYCSPDIAAFAAAHIGDTIGFTGYIGAIDPHDGTATRYDILIGGGNYSETSAPGPAFQFRDVNTTNDMRWIGEVPGSVGVGTNLAVTAEVDRYEESSCLFLIEPVSTLLS